MNGRNEENLKELLEQFLGDGEAEKTVADIQKGEQILRENAAPQPDDELIAEIKSEIAMRLLRKQRSVFRRIAYEAAAVAAAVIILGGIGIKLFEKDSGEPEKQYASLIPTAIWDSEDIAADDAELAIFTAEIEQIEDELLALRLGENGGNGDTALDEIEMEMIEIGMDFWEG